MSITRVFSSLQYRNYRLYWFGNLAAQAGMGLQQLALGWLVINLTNSEFDLGLLGFASGIAQFCFALVGGLVVDQFDRHRLMITNRAVALILVIVLATLTAVGRIQLWQILLVSFCLGTVNAINIPTFQALWAHLVPRKHLPNAIALHFVGLQCMRILGPLIGGLLISAVDIAGALMTQAVGYLYTLALVMRMKFPPGMRPPRTPHRSQLAETFDYVRHRGIVRALLAIEAAPVLFAVPYSYFLPVFARDVFRMDAKGLALLTATVGAGAAIGAGLAAWRGDYRNKGHTLIISGITFGVALVSLGLSRWLSLSLLALFVAGLSASTNTATNSTLLQLEVPDHLRGRVSSLNTMVWGLVPFGSLAMGAAAEFMGVRFVVVVGGFITLTLVAIISALSPALRTV